MTDRVITAESGECLNYSEVTSTNEASRRNYTYTNSSGYTSWIDIPYALEEPGSTSYIYRGFHQPEVANEQKCGSPGTHCMTMWAHRNLGGGQSSMFHQCPITVSDVSNIKHDAQQISSDVFLLAAASIGINGRGSDNDKRYGWKQYQFSPFG